jgi:small subunit ribosomal protein S16
MPARIRLKRTGTKNAPCHRIVVIDSRRPRDSKVIEELGYYDPRHNTEQLDLERAEYWTGVGAKPSETVQSIIDRVKAGKTLTPPKPRKSKKALAKDEAAKQAKEEQTEEKPDEQKAEAAESAS